MLFHHQRKSVVSCFYTIKLLKYHSLFSENRSRKLKKLILPLLLALKLKMAVIVPAMLLLIKFISIKALVSGMLALMFSGKQRMRVTYQRDYRKKTAKTATITSTIFRKWNRNMKANKRLKSCSVWLAPAHTKNEHDSHFAAA
jgi:Protein of unknown function (DUF1676)